MGNYEEYEWNEGRGAYRGMGAGRGVFARTGAAYGAGRERGAGRGNGAGFGGGRAGRGMGQGMHGMYYDRGFGRGFVGLRYWILSLLSEKERTGAQIADELESMSEGRWRPSPGHIYPTLSDMEEEGYIKAREESNQKYYSITQEGKRLLGDFGMPMGRGVWHHSGDPSLALHYIRSYIAYLKRSKELIKSDENKREEVKELIEELGSLLE